MNIGYSAVTSPPPVSLSSRWVFHARRGSRLCLYFMLLFLAGGVSLQQKNIHSEQRLLCSNPQSHCPPLPEMCFFSPIGEQSCKCFLLLLFLAGGETFTYHFVGFALLPSSRGRVTGMLVRSQLGWSPKFWGGPVQGKKGVIGSLATSGKWEAAGGDASSQPQQKLLLLLETFVSGPYKPLQHSLSAVFKDGHAACFDLADWAVRPLG